MIDYKWLRIINYLYIVVVIAVIGLSLTIPPRTSALRRALPAIVAILSIDALRLLPAIIIRCPKCRSHKVTAPFPMGQLKPGKIIYCPMCGELIEIVEPDDPRLRK